MEIKQLLRKFGSKFFMRKKEKSESEYEICILCGIATDILFDTPIDSRQNYVYGCGQLCKKCAAKLEKSQKEEKAKESK